MKTISEILKKKNGIVEFEAFLDTVRDKKWVMFVILKDATGEIQLTVDKGIEEQVKFVEKWVAFTKSERKYVLKEIPDVLHIINKTMYQAKIQYWYDIYKAKGLIKE